MGQRTWVWRFYRGKCVSVPSRHETGTPHFNVDFWSGDPGSTTTRITHGVSVYRSETPVGYTSGRCLLLVPGVLGLRCYTNILGFDPEIGVKTRLVLGLKPWVDKHSVQSRLLFSSGELIHRGNTSFTIILSRFWRTVTPVIVVYGDCDEDIRRYRRYRMTSQVSVTVLTYVDFFTVP